MADLIGLDSLPPWGSRSPTPLASPLAILEMSPKKISRDDWTRLTTDCEDARRKLLPGLFHRRWEIETTYHELKVDQGMDRHLCSRTVESIPARQVNEGMGLSDVHNRKPSNDRVVACRS